MTSATPPTFADPAAVAAGWRALSDTEKVRATELLAAAARWIRRKRDEAGYPIADGDPDARLVSVEVVRGALQRDEAARAAAKYAGFSNVSRTVGPRSFSGTIANSGPAAEALVWTDWAYDTLGLDRGGKAPRSARGYFGDGAHRERF